MTSACRSAASSFRLCALLIFGFAFVVRLTHMWQMRRSPFFTVLMGDSRGYDEWARRLAVGDWIGTDVFYQAPLYPYFLGVLYALFDRDLLVVRIVQATLSSGSCVFLGLAAARLFSARAGLIAGLMFALYAPAIFLDALIQKSILDAFFMCLILWLSSELAIHPERRGVWLGLGTALGALSLTRENTLVLVVVILAWASFTELRAPSTIAVWRTRFGGTLALLLGLTIVLAPVAARTALVGGGFVLTTAQLGPNLYIGNNPRANGTYMSLREGREDPAYERQDATELAQQALGRPLSPGDVSSFWRDRALQYITSEPAGWLALLARKSILLLNATEMIDTEAQESHAEWSLPLRWAGYVGHFGILLPLALVGVVVTWPDRRRLWIFYAMALGYAASVLLFFVVARYRYPLVPFVALFAAVGVARLPRFARQAPPATQVALAAGVIIAFVLTQQPVLSSDVMRGITETNVAVALHDQGRLDEAAAHYRRAIEIRPDYAPAYNNLGVTLRAQGRLDAAIAAYRQALERRPDYLEVHYNLATALVEQHLPEEAIAHYRIARRSMPMTVGAHNHFGVALAALGYRDEAIVEFRAALGLEPDSTATLRNLGDALARQRQYPEAIELFRRMTELDYNNPATHYDFGNVLMEAGRLPEAANQYRAAIQLAPDSPQAHRNLGIALAAQEQIDEAITEFRQALGLKPDDAEVQRYLAMALRSRRR